LQRPIPDKTQHLQETDIHTLGGIWTHNPGTGAAADLRLRTHRRWHRQYYK